MAEFETRLIMVLGSIAVAAGGIAGTVKFLAMRKDSERQRLRRKKLEEGDTLALARIALEDGDYERAAMHFATSERLVDAARAYAKAEMWDRAAQTYEHLKDYEKAAEYYGHRGDHQSQIRVYRKASLWTEAARVAAAHQEYGKAASLLIKGGLKADAARMYKKAGHKTQAHLLAAELHEEAGQWELAAHSWTRVKKLERAAYCLRRAEHWDLAARAMVKHGAHREAADLLAEHGQPDAAGRIYERLQMFDAAAKCYSKAGDVSREARCRFLSGDKMAVIRLRITSGELDEALRVAESIKTVERDFVEAAQIAAGLRETDGDTKGALSNLRRLLAVTLPLSTRRRVTRHAAELAHQAKLRAVGEEVIEAFLTTSEVTESEETWVPELRADLAELPVDQAQPVPEAKQYDAPSRTDDTGEDDFVEAADRAIERSARDLRIRESGLFSPEPIHAPENWPQGIPVTLAQRYEGLTPIGRGGNGMVYRAVDTLMEREVALKFMIESAMPDELARRYFLREMKVATELTHPHIVRIYDSGITENTLYYSMELLHGKPLRMLFANDVPIADRGVVLRVFEQLCDAVSYAHAAGLVHRDIKPDNVFYQNDGNVKLLDFGLAKVFDDGFGEHSVLAGTPFYMAPEQIHGRDLDGRADVYALGVIFYRAMTGHLPFSTGNVLLAHATEAPPDPRSFVPTISNSICAVIDKALQKKPQDRYASCGELKEAIQFALGETPW